MESRPFPTWIAALYLIVRESYSITSPCCGEELNSSTALHHCHHKGLLRAGLFIGNLTSKVISETAQKAELSCAYLGSARRVCSLAPPVGDMLRQNSHSDCVPFILARPLRKENLCKSSGLQQMLIINLFQKQPSHNSSLKQMTTSLLRSDTGSTNFKNK